jgi:ABC-type transport system involved in multi-copper enzyme maturation permease subunit
MTPAAPGAEAGRGAIGRFFHPGGSPFLRGVVGAVRAVPRLVASPIVRLELAAAFRRKRFVAVFTVALLAVLAILVGTIVAFIGSPPARIGQAVFTAFVIALGLVVFLLFPAFSCMSLVEERAQKSLDLLLTTSLAPWEIFAGKLLGSFVYCFTFLVATAPVVALSFLFGGVEPAAIVAAYAIAIADALLVCTIGTYASAAAPGSIRAILTAYFLVFVIGYAASLASFFAAAYWVGPSMGLFSGHDRRALEQIMALFGVPVHLGAVIAYALLGIFFAIVGANRLKPPSHDRATPMRTYTVAFFLTILGCYGYTIKKVCEEAARSGWKDLPEELYITTLAALVLAAAPLFLAVLIFSTESCAISRRVKNALARLSPVSPARLFAPGPGRGMWFCFALTALVVGAIGGYGLFALGLEHARVLEWSRYNAPFGAPPRGDLGIIETALVIAAFLGFLAAFGRFLAERPRGTPTAPRIALAAVAAALTLLPLLPWVAEENAGHRTGIRTGAAEDGIPTIIARGHFLSPFLACASSMGAYSSWRDWARYTLRPREIEAVQRVPLPELFEGERFSATPMARAEWRAIPVHRLTIAFYLAAAALFAGLGALRERRRLAVEAALVGPTGSVIAVRLAPPPLARRVVVHLAFWTLAFVAVRQKQVSYELAGALGAASPAQWIGALLGPLVVWAIAYRLTCVARWWLAMLLLGAASALAAIDVPLVGFAGATLMLVLHGIAGPRIAPAEGAFPEEGAGPSRSAAALSAPAPARAAPDRPAKPPLCEPGALAPRPEETASARDAGGAAP